MTVLCIISVLYSHAASAMLLTGAARSTDASGVSLDRIVCGGEKSSGEVKIAIAPATAPATPAAVAVDGDKDDNSIVALADGVERLSLAPGVRARSASMTPSDEKICRLLHVIDSPAEEHLDEVKFLVIHCGIDDDLYARVYGREPSPQFKSPFWHALVLLVDDKEPSGASYTARFKMLEILAGISPESKKRPTICGAPLHYVVKHDHRALAAFLLDNTICNPNRYHTDNGSDSERHTALFDATTIEMVELLVRKGVVPLFAGDLRPDKMGYFKLVRNGSSWKVLSRIVLEADSKDALSDHAGPYILPDGVSAPAEFRSLLLEACTGHEPFRYNNIRELTHLLAYFRTSMRTLAQFPSREYGEVYGVQVGPLKFVAQYADRHLVADVLRNLLIQGFVWLEVDEELDKSCEKLVGDARTQLIASDSYRRVAGTSCCKPRCRSCTKLFFQTLGGILILAVVATGIVYDHNKNK